MNTSFIPGWMFAQCSSAVTLNESRGLIRSGSSYVVGQTGSIRLAEVWGFLATRIKQIFLVLWGCQVFLNLSSALRSLCQGFLHFPCSDWEIFPKTSILCLMLLGSLNLDRSSRPDVEKTENMLISLVATLVI